MSLEWVKSVSGALKVNGVDVSGAPVQIVLTPAVKTLIRDKALVLTTAPEPIENKKPKKGGTGK